METKVYLMEFSEGTSKTGNPYARAVLMDEKGRRQSFFLGAQEAAILKKDQADILSPSMTELIPLIAEIDPFAGRLISLQEA